MDEETLELIHQVRKEVWGNVYRPIPILSRDTDEKGAGKRPAGTGPNWSRWEQDARQDPPHAVNAKPSAYATNTGILADGLRAVDGDVDDSDLAATGSRWKCSVMRRSVIERTALDGCDFTGQRKANRHTSRYSKMKR
jgi:hypothetical protein